MDKSCDANFSLERHPQKCLKTSRFKTFGISFCMPNFSLPDSWQALFMTLVSALIVMLLGRTLWPLHIVGREVDDELYMIQKIGACQINHHYNSLYILYIYIYMLAFSRFFPGVACALAGQYVSHLFQPAIAQCGFPTSAITSIFQIFKFLCLRAWHYNFLLLHGS